MAFSIESEISREDKKEKRQIQFIENEKGCQYGNEFST